jgi:type II restriction/modification system DNA methylase subunit YeeA
LKVTPSEFIAKWRENPLGERQASHSHFIDLCSLLEEPAPYAPGTDRESYCFERGATKTTGSDGWADVWKRGVFGWEYKGPKKDLTAAYVQLQQYAVALENPPLLIVCDRERFRIHTNFTNSVSKVYDVSIDELADPEKRALLKAAFSDPESLRPEKTRQALTVEVASEFASLAQRLRDRGHDPQRAAHFINRLVFCMFAEAVGLLPNDMFKRMLQPTEQNPSMFRDLARDLFAVMQRGGRVGFETVDWFNGGLFDSDEALPLEREDINLVLRVARQDWSDVDPSILGTLFERGLDPDKRSQLGAHYTDREKIMQIIEPVLVRPLMAEWHAVRLTIAEQLDKAAKARARRPEKQSQARSVHASARREEEAALRQARRLHETFVERLRNVRILDPACGSGNFLYLSILSLKDVEHRANLDAEVMGLGRFSPTVGPECLKGIEKNPYAAELARITVWIGEIQWMRKNGFDVGRHPILRPLETIECRDAVLGPDGREATWPQAEFIVGNPPYLGAKLMNRKLGAEYTERLRGAYRGRLKNFSDLVCFWFEKARSEVVSGRSRHVGLVATSSIRGGTNRPVMDAIAQVATIHDAWSEQPWTIEGARVEVSIVCFSGRDVKTALHLDGIEVPNINSDLTTGTDLTRAKPLEENDAAAFLGVQTSGPLDVSGSLARQWMNLPSNPNGKSNRSILRPYWNGDDVTGRPRDQWLIDFPPSLDERAASIYEAPFEYLKAAAYLPERGKPAVNFANYRRTTPNQNPLWWEPHRPRPEMRRRIESLRRYIVTPETSEYRIFVWLSFPTIPDKNLIVIARDDDETFGVLQSRFHEAWALRLGTSLEDRPRYTHTTTFATFPFPHGLEPNPERSNRKLAVAGEIAKAVRALNELREAWLNPSDLVRWVENGPGLPPRPEPRSEECEKSLRARTLTNLYNQRPTWLEAAHRALDAAVADAYGVSANISNDEILSMLLDLNFQRSNAAMLIKVGTIATKPRQNPKKASRGKSR